MYSVYPYSICVYVHIRMCMYPYIYIPYVYVYIHNVSTYTVHSICPLGLKSYIIILKNLGELVQKLVSIIIGTLTAYLASISFDLE